MYYNHISSSGSSNKFQNRVSIDDINDNTYSLHQHIYPNDKIDEKSTHRFQTNHHNYTTVQNATQPPPNTTFLPDWSIYFSQPSMQHSDHHTATPPHPPKTSTNLFTKTYKVSQLSSLLSTEHNYTTVNNFWSKKGY